MGGKYMEKGTDGAIQTGWHHSWREGNARYTRQYATRTAASYLKSAAAPSGNPGPDEDIARESPPWAERATRQRWREERRG